MERNSNQSATPRLNKTASESLQSATPRLNKTIARFAGIAALGLMAASLTSCSLDAPFEDIEESMADSDIITFRVQTSGMTRAADSYSNSIRPSHFLVTALDGESSYFGEQPEIVSTPDNGNTWNSENRLYWPSGKSSGWQGLTFYAFIDGNDPEYLNNPNGRSTSGQLDMASRQPALRNFVVDRDVECHRDLMYAVAKNVTKTSGKGKVQLNFRHALSQICFTAQNCNPNLDDIEILKIELGGVKGAASYSFPDASTDAVRASDNSDCGTWTLAPGASDMTYTLSNLFISLGHTDASGRGKLINISKPCYSKEKGAVTVSNLSNTMYLIPQQAPARVMKEDPEGAYVKVTARKTPRDTGVAGQPEVTYIPLDVNWEEGRNYIYNLTWKATAISFSVTVSDYDTVAVTE